MLGQGSPSALLQHSYVVGKPKSLNSPIARAGSNEDLYSICGSCEHKIV